jgi:hypothetical protein
VDGKTELATIPAGEWYRVHISATTGSSKWSVELTRKDGSEQSFPTLTCKPTWTSASYLLFSSLGTQKTAFYLDNIKLESR